MKRTITFALTLISLVVLNAQAHLIDGKKLSLNDLKSGETYAIGTSFSGCFNASSTSLVITKKGKKYVATYKKWVQPYDKDFSKKKNRKPTTEITKKLTKEDIVTIVEWQKTLKKITSKKIAPSSMMNQGNYHVKVANKVSFSGQGMLDGYGGMLIKIFGNKI